MLRALPIGYAVRSQAVISQVGRSQAVSGYAVSGHGSLRLCIVSPALVVSRRVGPAQWRGAGCLAGGSIIGPRPFWFFLGQCQKEQTLLTDP